MILENIYPVAEINALARQKKNKFEMQSVTPNASEQFTSNGWDIVRAGKTSIRLRREKSHDRELEDRVWTLCFNLGFLELSGEGGAKLLHSVSGPTNQLDVFAADLETAIVVECKSSEIRQRRTSFQHELGKFSMLREALFKAIRAKYGSDAKRQLAMVMFIRNSIISDSDRDRAKAQNISILDEKDLEYYEELVNHLGEAARYQFLADLLPGKVIPNLNIRIPAIKSKMAGHTCYSFSISPEYLLKISYVSHRSKGKASDVNTYQRMIKKTRLRDIRRYIETGEGVFPTNIVINLDTRVTFDRGVQGDGTSTDLLGWASLRPTYKSAWIIDGQHRLFAYSGSPRAASSRLSVLAFEKLDPGTQAQLFIDINAKQKSVNQSLLQELYAELHWTAEDPRIRLRAVISKTIQTLDSDVDSPFFQRIKGSEDKPSPTKCITLRTLFDAIHRDELYVSTTRNGSIPSYGPLYSGGENAATLKRTCGILNTWFGEIRELATDWWDLGRAEGGGLAMNDSIVAQTNVLRSILQCLDEQGYNLVSLKNCDLNESVRPYAKIVGSFLGAMAIEDRKRYRELRGIQGQTTRARRCQQAIHEAIPDYCPPELREFQKQEAAQTNTRAKELVDLIEGQLQKTIIEELVQ